MHRGMFGRVPARFVVQSLRSRPFSSTSGEHAASSGSQQKEALKRGMKKSRSEVSHMVWAGLSLFLGIQVAQNAYNHREEKKAMEETIQASKQKIEAFEATIESGKWATTAIQQLGLKANQTQIKVVRDAFAAQLQEQIAESEVNRNTSSKNDEAEAMAIVAAAINEATTTKSKPVTGMV